MTEKKINAVQAALDAAHAAGESIQEQTASAVANMSKMADTVLERLRAKKQEKDKKQETEKPLRLVKTAQ